MNFKSIKVKVILSIVLCLALGACAIVYLLNSSYKNNIDLIAKQSIAMSEETFNNLQKNDVKMMSTTLTAIMANKEYKEIYVQKDRDKLTAATTPLFNKLKKDYNITGMVFYSPEPEKKFFLRVHKPKEFGDVNDRATFNQAIETKQMASGIELGKHAYSLRVVSPYYDNNNTLLGYMELNEDIDHFFGLMKKQTGNEYGLLIGKKNLKEENWASMRKTKDLTNNWGALPDVVLASNTANDDSIVDFKDNIQDVPKGGKVLEEVKKDGSVFVRGIFPLYDASGAKIGGVFVLRDITATYNEMKAMQNKAILFIVMLILIISVIMILIFQNLIFKRLNNMIAIATRVVGGDYHTQITASADDEIGKFESLFEQFRAVFVNLVNDLEQKDK